MNVEAGWEAKFRIQGIGIDDSEMMAIALKKGGDGHGAEMVGCDGVAGHDAGPGGLGKRRVIFREAGSRDRAGTGAFVPRHCLARSLSGTRWWPWAN
jgi:hypothetical protein